MSEKNQIDMLKNCEFKFGVIILQMNQRLFSILNNHFHL